MAKPPPPTQRAVQTAEVVRLRCEGRSFREIEQIAGIPKSVANRLALAALAELRVRTSTDIEHAVTLELARMNEALNVVMPAIRGGDLAAVDRLCRLSERRSKLLGLDLPVKVAPTDPTGTREYGEGIGLAALIAEARKQKGD